MSYSGRATRQRFSSESAGFGIRSAQVFLLYHRHDYDRAYPAVGVTRAASYFAPEVDGLITRTHNLARYCMSSSGTKMSYPPHHAIVAGKRVTLHKYLKRKDNELALRL